MDHLDLSGMNEEQLVELEADLHEQIVRQTVRHLTHEEAGELGSKLMRLRHVACTRGIVSVISGRAA